MREKTWTGKSRIDLVRLDIAEHESNFNRYTPNILAAIISGFLMTTAE